MVIRLIRVISSVEDGDYKLGIRYASLYKGKDLEHQLKTNPEIVPIKFGEQYLHKVSIPSPKQEQYISQGLQQAALDLGKGIYYLKFRTATGAELGFSQINTSRVDETVKVADFVIQPFIDEDFKDAAATMVAGINWLMMTGKKHRYPFQFFKYEGIVPVKITEPLTIEDFIA